MANNIEFDTNKKFLDYDGLKTYHAKLMEFLTGQGNIQFNDLVIVKGDADNSAMLKNSDSIASGKYSIALGSGVHATGNYSFAEGKGTRATNTSAHAEGYETFATGKYSHSEGIGATASGEGSHAEGGYYVGGVGIFRGGQALGRSSHAEGYSTEASGEGSHAEGVKTVAKGSGSHAEGGYFIDSYNSVAGGQALGKSSHAEGVKTVARGDMSHVEGFDVEALGKYSHAEGGSEQEIKVFMPRLTPVNGEKCKYKTDLTQIPNNDPKFLVGNWVANIHYINDSGEIVYDPQTSIKITSVINSTSIYIVTDKEIIGYPNGNGGFDKLNNTPVLFVKYVDKPTNSDISYTVTAAGDASHAEGSEGTKSAGFASHAEGCHTFAGGTYSHSEGVETEARGFASHAEGNLSVTGTYAAFSHAEGSGTKALGARSHAEGIDTIASGEDSHAEGDNTQSIGNNSHAEGSGTKAIGFQSHAEGLNSEASGTSAHAEGYGTFAKGARSHAEGRGTYAYSQECHAEGWNTKAGVENDPEVNAAHAEGKETEASGRYSHAEGVGTVASGQSSHAEGDYTTASGRYSHAGGYHTIASKDAEFATGKYNKSNTDTLFSVGNGTTDTNRKNAFEVTSSKAFVHGKQIATLNDIPTSITIDTKLNPNSNNPIANSAVANAIKGGIRFKGVTGIPAQWDEAESGILVFNESMYDSDDPRDFTEIFNEWKDENLNSWEPGDLIIDGNKEYILVEEMVGDAPIIYHFYWELLGETTAIDQRITNEIARATAAEAALTNSVNNKADITYVDDNFASISSIPRDYVRNSSGDDAIISIENSGNEWDDINCTINISSSYEYDGYTTGIVQSSNIELNRSQIKLAVSDDPDGDVINNTFRLNENGLEISLNTDVLDDGGDIETVTNTLKMSDTEFTYNDSPVITLANIDELTPNILKADEDGVVNKSELSIGNFEIKNDREYNYTFNGKYGDSGKDLVWKIVAEYNHEGPKYKYFDMWGGESVWVYEFVITETPKLDELGDENLNPDDYRPEVGSIINVYAGLLNEDYYHGELAGFDPQPLKFVNDVSEESYWDFEGPVYVGTFTRTAPFSLRHTSKALLNGSPVITAQTLAESDIVSGLDKKIVDEINRAKDAEATLTANVNNKADKSYIESLENRIKELEDAFNEVFKLIDK